MRENEVLAVGLGNCLSLPELNLHVPLDEWSLMDIKQIYPNVQGMEEGVDLLMMYGPALVRQSILIVPIPWIRKLEYAYSPAVPASTLRRSCGILTHAWPLLHTDPKRIIDASPYNVFSFHYTTCATSTKLQLPHRRLSQARSSSS